MKQNMSLVRILVVALLLMTGLIGGCGGQEEQQAVKGDGTDSASINRPQPPPPTGACCLPDLTCMESTAEECEAAGGWYKGDGIDCALAYCDT
ncbi:MAG: hypothetical protein SWQ30_18330 [Thermodesulfobacteriota bacterium]|nr:hypothetical protein [Thermodesulfobacteriota bacterium]